MKTKQWIRSKINESLKPCEDKATCPHYYTESGEACKDCAYGTCPTCGKVMQKSHRQKEIISELDDQLELLEKKRSYSGRSVEYYTSIGGEIAILKLIIKLLANHMWRSE